MLSTRVDPPAGLRWTLDAHNIERVAAKIATQLEWHIPRWLSLLDRDQLTAALDDGDVPATGAGIAARIVTRVDNGLTDELTAMLNEFEGSPEFAEWAYRRASTR